MTRLDVAKELSSGRWFFAVSSRARRARFKRSCKHHARIYLLAGGFLQSRLGSRTSCTDQTFMPKHHAIRRVVGNGIHRLQITSDKPRLTPGFLYRFRMFRLKGRKPYGGRKPPNEGDLVHAAVRQNARQNAMKPPNASHSAEYQLPRTGLHGTPSPSPPRWSRKGTDPLLA